MKKIPTLFQRDYSSGKPVLTEQVTPGCEWVLLGEGQATQKLDGTCCMVRDGRLFKRYTLKTGKPTPAAFEPATEVDPETGKQEGWVPVDPESPEDQYHAEAFRAFAVIHDGTFELIGPKVQGNPEGAPYHRLVPHGADKLNDLPFPLTFSGLREYLKERDMEGIVWHHPDGRMVKIKKRDFGMKR